MSNGCLILCGNGGFRVLGLTVLLPHLVGGLYGPANRFYHGAVAARICTSGLADEVKRVL
jgi:hypothetical protein